MIIEVINAPHSIKEIKRLMDDDNVYFMINTYEMLCQLYKRAKKDTSELDPLDYWKLKPLKKMYEHSNDPEMFLSRMTRETFIRIA